MPSYLMNLIPSPACPRSSGPARSPTPSSDPRPLQAVVVNVPNAQWLLLVADNGKQSPSWLWPVVGGVIAGAFIFGALAMSTMVSNRMQQHALDVTLVR